MCKDKVPHMKLARTTRAFLSLLCLLPGACTADQVLGQRPGVEPNPAEADSETPDAGNPVLTPDTPDAPDAPDAPDGKDSGTSKDTTSPVVVLNATPTTVTAAGTISLTAAASDVSGITSVVIYAGATALSTLDAAPYAIRRAVTQADNGTYVFTAEATDPAGNVGRSAPVTVTVNIAGPPQPSVPTFVGAGAATLITGATSLAVSTPGAIQANDFLLAMINAQEESGPRTLPAPAGWTLIGGFPVHNVASAYPPYVIPASQSHGTWIFHKFAVAGEPATTTFDFPTAATARGVIVSYRGVDTSAPIRDKSSLGFYGSGGTNGLGSGNTSNQPGRQVNLIATALTDRATYTVVKSSPTITERFNTGEQPNGLNLVVHDGTTSFGIFTGPSIANKKSPSGSTDGFLFSATTLVLKPQ